MINLTCCSVYVNVINNLSFILFYSGFKGDCYTDEDTFVQDTVVGLGCDEKMTADPIGMLQVVFSVSNTISLVSYASHQTDFSIL